MYRFFHQIVSLYNLSCAIFHIVHMGQRPLCMKKKLCTLNSNRKQSDCSTPAQVSLDHTQGLFSGKLGARLVYM